MQVNGLLAFSVELANEAATSYLLQTNGRYQHAETYIKELAEKKPLKLLRYASVIGRQQDNEAIQTGLFIFKKI